VKFLDALTQPQAIIFAGVLGVITALATNLVAHLLTMRGQDKRRWDNRRLDATWPPAWAPESNPRPDPSAGAS
jgi:hypothetical protein